MRIRIPSPEKFHCFGVAAGIILWRTEPYLAISCFNLYNFYRTTFENESFLIRCYILFMFAVLWIWIRNYLLRIRQE